MQNSALLVVKADGTYNNSHSTLKVNTRFTVAGAVYKRPQQPH
jgi:hypothetical protein